MEKLSKRTTVLAPRGQDSGRSRESCVEALLAGFWGLVGGISLLIGAVIGLYSSASQRVISVVMAVGAGVLISSVAFESMEGT